MKYIILIILTILTSAIATAQRQQGFECVNDQGQRCECTYDKRFKKLEISCDGGYAADYKRSRPRERVIVRSNPQRKRTR